VKAGKDFYDVMPGAEQQPVGEARQARTSNVTAKAGKLCGIVADPAQQGVKFVHKTDTYTRRLGFVPIDGGSNFSFRH